MRYSVDFITSNLRNYSCSAAVLALLLTGATTVWADDSAGNDSNVKVSGFLSVVAGKVLSGSYDGTVGAYHYQCPCYIADWANGGVYRSNWSLEPETHGGVQLDYTFNNSLSATVQVTSRGPKVTPEFQYAFIDYKINGHWNVHVGRERLPLYYYSEFQDIGVAYPWVSPPAEVYGWEVTNFNGGSIHYKDVFGGVRTNAEIYGGSERVTNAAETAFISYPNAKGNAFWKDIFGAEAEFTKSFWTIHANYMTALNSWNDYSGNNLATQRITIMGVAANLDFDDWFIVSEGGQFTRNNYLYGFTEKNPSYSVGVGYRYGAWTPLINYAKFVDHYTYQVAQFPVPQFPNGGWGATLRYDIDPKSDIKIQYDKFQDMSFDAGFSGNAKVLRISYDVAF